MGSRFPTIFLMVVLVPVGTAAQSSGTTHQAKNTHVRPDITWSSETQHADVYYVRAYRKGAYVIDHKGVRITAKCRNSLYWPNGLGTFGTPVKEHGCVYMHDLIGKSVGEDLMKQWNDTLVYSRVVQHSVVGRFLMTYSADSTVIWPLLKSRRIL